MLRIVVLSSLFALFSVIAGQDNEFSRSRFRNLLEFAENSSLLATQSNLDRIREIAFKIDEEFSSCRPNVCFGLDGSAVVSAEMYRLQTEIAQIITAIVGGLLKVRLFGVQYGGILQFISEDEESRAQFQRSLGASEPIGSSFTFIAPAVQFCSSQFMLKDEKVPTESPEIPVAPRNRIVLLAGSGSSFLDNGPFGAVAIGKRFMENGEDNRITALIMGNSSPAEKLLREVVGDGQAFTASGTDAILSAIGNIVLEICA